MKRSSLQKRLSKFAPKQFHKISTGFETACLGKNVKHAQVKSSQMTISRPIWSHWLDQFESFGHKTFGRKTSGSPKSKKRGGATLA